jgi:hypothetical protein
VLLGWFDDDCHDGPKIIRALVEGDGSTGVDVPFLSKRYGSLSIDLFDLGDFG